MKISALGTAAVSAFVLLLCSSPVPAADSVPVALAMPADLARQACPSPV